MELVATLIENTASFLYCNVFKLFLSCSLIILALGSPLNKKIELLSFNSWLLVAPLETSHGTIFLAMQGTSSFPAGHEVYEKTTENGVPSWE